MKKLLCFISVIYIVTGLFSCKSKTSETNYNPNVLSAKDYIRAEDAMFEIVNVFYKGIHDSLVLNTNYGYIDYCEIYWYPEDSLFTFGYGDVDRMCEDGKFRRGSFYAQYNGEKWAEGVTVTISTDRLYVDDSLVEARMVLTKNGYNADNLLEYQLETQYCRIKLADSTKLNPVTISANFLLEWAQGFATPEIHEDDIYLVSGTASGISSDLYEFSVEILDPLTDPIDCYWIYAGLSQITVPNADFKTGTIDYIMEDGCFNEMNFYFNDNKFYDILK
jgi:hypothetical protein